MKDRAAWIQENWSSPGFDRRRIRLGLLAVLLVMLAEIVAFVLLESVQFQRLGSIVVVLSICLVPYYKSLAEVMIQSGRDQQEIGVANHLAHANFASGWLMEQLVFIFAVVFAAVGTLQWGYGDLFHCWLQ